MTIAEKYSQCEKKNENLSSIFDSFDISNEIDYLYSQFEGGSSEKDILKMSEAELKNFLEEFAGKNKQQTIQYYWNDNKLYPPGGSESMIEILKKTASINDGSREIADYEYFVFLESFLNRNDFGLSIQISPPSVSEDGKDFQDGFGNYGFCTISMNNDGIVDNYIIRYDESSDLSNSKKLYEKLFALSGNLCSEDKMPANTENFIKSPLLFHADEGGDLMDLLSRVEDELGADNIRKSSIFFENVYEQIGDFIEKYHQKILECVKIKSQGEHIGKDTLEELKKYINVIYNIATEIKKDINNGYEKNLCDNRCEDEEELFVRYGFEGFTEGGSCPVVGSIFTDSDLQVIITDTNGQSILYEINEREKEKIDFYSLEERKKETGQLKCPKCGEKVSYLVADALLDGFLHCPKCKLTAKGCGFYTILLNGLKKKTHGR